MGDNSGRVGVRRFGFAVFAAIAVVLMANSLAQLIIGPAVRWPIALVGVLCVATLELACVSLVRKPRRTPAISLPVIALPALSPAVPQWIAVGVIALGVFLIMLVRTQRTGVALYGGGLAGVGAAASVIIFNALTSTSGLLTATAVPTAAETPSGVPGLVAGPIACVGYIVVVLALEVLRLRLTKATPIRVTLRSLWPLRIAVVAAACVVLSFFAALWSDHGLPFVYSRNDALNTIIVLLVLTVLAGGAKLVIRNTVMQGRLNGLIHGASALSELAKYARPVGTASTPKAVAVCESTRDITDTLCETVADAIGVETVDVQTAPPRRGEIGAEVVLGDDVVRYIVAHRDPMDLGFNADDRKAISALAHTANLAVKSRRNIGGLTERANTDPLTGLPNYGAFQEALTNINEHRDYSEALAVLFLDLDDFKKLNDRYGHQTGDGILSELGRRLSQVVRPHDVVARVGGDEFVIILTHLSSLPEAKRIAERIMEFSGEPLTVGATTFSPVLSVGLAYSAHRETDINQLVQDADRSMLEIKKARRRNGVAKASSLSISSHRSSQLNDVVARAIDEDRLELAFQPIVSLVTGQIWAFEALMRYTDAELGPISPSTFVEKAKGLGRLDKLTRQVAVKAMAAAAEFRLIEPQVFCMAINVEAGQILPRRVGSFFEDLAERYPGISLCLELNERSVAKVSTELREQAEHLRDIGMMIALDDYGSRDSSVDALVRVPMDILKIDRSLVDDLGDIRQREVLTALQGFGDKLEYSMVVEGVENDAMARHLHAIGIRNAQGFHYGVPRSFARTIARLEEFGALAVLPAVRDTATTPTGTLRAIRAATPV
ncbi:EAL domain-containing protein [Glaciibacter sp. 2TAF33]|uniref:EAL domain-containing protein n=1 Tax=Glaciibacter sp. 2TAF33 TaxID=3233015 RepID=UPI003F8E8F2C